MSASTEYEAARRAAIGGDIAEALALTEGCAASAPGSLPAQKLRVLVLAAAGRTVAADDLRVRLADVFPREPDFRRWAFSAPAATVKPAVSRRRGRRSAPRQREAAASRPRGRPGRWGQVSRPVSLVAFALAAASLVISYHRSLDGPASRLLTEPPAAAAAPKRVAAEGTSPVPKASEIKSNLLAADLSREWEQRRRETDFAQARRWFNHAARAKEAGDWDECDRFAAAAFVLAKNSYLGDESLVLRALAADNTGRSMAYRMARYAAIAQAFPGSAYAPWALRKAVRLAERDGNTAKARFYRQLLTTGYPPSPAGYRQPAARRRGS
jgi:hypothetical protein